jgi:hypothetical protein
MARQIQHGAHQIRIDALHQHAGRRAITVRDHHRIDRERTDADDAREQADLLHHVAIIAKLARVLEHQHVRVDAEHLLAKLRAKAARHAHHRHQRRRAE